MRAKCFTSLICAAVLCSACAAIPEELVETPESASMCDAETGAALQMLVGTWSLHIEADEGWTGYGESTIAWDSSHVCGILETSEAVFNQESETPFENRSTSLIVFDSLSETMKLLTSDRRGFVHLGFGSDDLMDLSFEIGQLGMSDAVRRIQYRKLSASGFEWVWQGRDAAETPWKDRLMIVYTRR
ncbi:MAG: hypothetical protein AAFZ91_00475 [Pseudomonadota bacterium]